MFGRINWRMVIIHSEAAAKDTADMIRARGFNVVDLKEAAIVDISSKEEMSKVYILCCEGEAMQYYCFKKELKFKEMIYEGFRTLF